MLQGMKVSGFIEGSLALPRRVIWLGERASIKDKYGQVSRVEKKVPHVDQPYRGTSGQFPYPGHARISLWELNYVLRESPYDSNDDDEILNTDYELNKLVQLYQRLKFIDADSQTYTAYHVLKFATRSTWN